MVAQLIGPVKWVTLAKQMQVSDVKKATMHAQYIDSDYAAVASTCESLYVRRSCSRRLQTQPIGSLPSPYVADIQTGV